MEMSAKARSGPLLKLVRACSFLAFTYTATSFATGATNTEAPQIPPRRWADEDRPFAASARERGEAFLGREEEKLLKSIVRAGRRRDWSRASAIIWDYSGMQTPIYSAALFAAIRCKQFDEGASIYEEMRQRSVWCDLPSFSMALKIFSKSDPSRVGEIWDEAVAEHPLDAALCAARLDAAAEAGDIQAAQTLLEQMGRLEPPMQPNLLHFTSAIRACKNADSEKSHEMAKSFFELALGQGIEPDIVVFRELMGACRRAPLHEVQTVYKFLKELGLQADRIFSDVYLRAVLQLPRSRRFQSIAEAAEELRAMQDKGRLAEARAVLAEFTSKDVQLTALGHLLNGALLQLQ